MLQLSFSVYRENIFSRITSSLSAYRRLCRWKGLLIYYFLQFLKHNGILNYWDIIENVHLTEELAHTYIHTHIHTYTHTYTPCDAGCKFADLLQLLLTVRVQIKCGVKVSISNMTHYRSFTTTTTTTSTTTLTKPTWSTIRASKQQQPKLTKSTNTSANNKSVQGSFILYLGTKYQGGQIDILKFSERRDRRRMGISTILWKGEANVSMKVSGGEGGIRQIMILRTNISVEIQCNKGNILQHTHSHTHTHTHTTHTHTTHTIPQNGDWSNSFLVSVRTYGSLDIGTHTSVV